MSLQVGDRVLRIRDQVKWQLLGLEGECLEMHGRLSAIRVVSDPIGVAIDINGQAWLIDLAEVEHENEEREIARQTIIGMIEVETEEDMRPEPEITEEDRNDFYGPIGGEK